MNALKYIMLSLITAGILAGCGTEQTTEKREVIRPAKLLDIKAATNIKTFSFPAVVKALHSKDLTFQVSGQIEKLNVREGQEVKQGDVIATLVTRNFKNQVKTAQTQFDAAKLDFDRAKRLINEGAIARNDYDQRLTQLNIASASLDSARKDLEDAVLLSPFDGIVAVKLAKELQTVSPSQPIVTLQTAGAAEAVVKIPASFVTHSQNIEPLKTVVILDSATQFEMDAEMVAAAALADERSQTFEVKFGFTPPESLTILPGMTGVVKSSLKLRNDADKVGQISIPLSAVLSDSDGQYVWTVEPKTMTVSRTNIKVGADIGDTITIESGLSEGQTIVIAGASYLNQGMKIRRLEQ